ncbi:uncharacterized protein LOC126621628 isoform X1 [Malus sylvestris]|uniref:uncharacterized protein LOC126621628 isoform X1 n=1 Tax=Malus sylvestris TaxID=3752 RepID=UPI0021AC8E07|nr:uncharacterized protein LOC126621628 isoform X1 [Malus sylvestris]
MASPKSIDASLWWDSFSLLLTELENASLSSDLPPILVKKLTDNHAWFVDTVSRFKPPNENSREALNSQQVKIGSHQLNIKPELKDKALKVSSYLCLDEVQSYILVERSLENKDVALDSILHEYFYAVIIHYYVERQCLLKCTRSILTHALSLESVSGDGNAIKKEALKLITDGLEAKLINVLQVLFSSSHPEQMDLDLFTLWAEETLIEDNLVLDILFLAYYESFCTCNGERWKTLCLLYKGTLSGSYNFENLAVSTEALRSSYQTKVQLLLILIETLDLESLLQMVHDAIPFRQGTFVFTLADVQEMEAIISTFNAFETKEAGPLILAWAVFLCLISSLPGSEESNVLMEIDHVGYVRQAFEAASLTYCVEILQSDVLKESDGPADGYHSVLRTFISAFIASYEINLQLEDKSLKLILDILCKIYQGEESLCIQFWDRESFIDGPIRCLLCNLEGEFPFRTVELVRFLSSLCEGTWPAECVYNFLDKSVGISSLVEINNGSVGEDMSQIVETHLPLHVPGFEGLVIPSKTCGHVLRLVSGNAALVRWEYKQSGVLVLLMRLSQELYFDRNDEALLILDLFRRMVTFNTAVCFALMDIGSSSHFQSTDMGGQIESNMRLVEIICTLVRKLSPTSGGAALMSVGINILAKMLRCSPSRVSELALKANIFDFSNGRNDPSSGSWFLSGKLAKMLLIDSEQNDSYCSLTISVLDFTLGLMETGLKNDAVQDLIVFSVQYVLVNHEYWKYKVKHDRWRVTLKVLEVMKKCITSISCSGKLDEAILDRLLSDSSIHSTLFRIVCTTTQALERLYFSRLVDPTEIEGLQMAICSVLDILFIMLSKFSKDISSSPPFFHQAVFSSATKPFPVVAALVSLISYFRNPGIQVGAARVLSLFLMMADFMQPYLFGSSFGLDDKQIGELRHSISYILLEQSELNEDLFVAAVNLLTSAARYQPAFLVAVLPTKANKDVQLSNGGGVKLPTNDFESEKASAVHAVLHHIERSNNLINSNPRILLNVLNFLRALWQGAGQYTNILECLKSSENFWKKLSGPISIFSSMQAPPPENAETEVEDLSVRYQCQSAILEIIAHDMFLHKKLLHAESFVKQLPESQQNTVRSEKSKAADLEDILSAWCGSSVLGNLTKSLTYCEYDPELYLRAKVAASVITARVMVNLSIGDAGSLSVSLLEKSRILSNKLRSHPAFSELLAQYSQHGYSAGKEPNYLILSDLYYHLQGELEGREISAGPFKELSRFLIESNVFQTYQHKDDGDLFVTGRETYLFDLKRVRADLGLDLWDYSKWKESKATAETMLHHMKAANSMALLTSSKLSALKALKSVLTVYGDNSLETKSTARQIPDQLVFSCIDHVCQSFHDTVESLAPVPGASEDVFHFLAAQAELLLYLMMYAHKSLPLSVCILVLKTSGSGLKALSDFRALVTGPSDMGVDTAVRLLLMLLLSAVEFSCHKSHLVGARDVASVEDVAKISNVSLSLLPVLCNCTATAEHGTLSLTTTDLILRNFLTPSTWLPIIQNHLQLQRVILKLQDKDSLESVPVIMKFFLTLARVRQGAEMLINYGFLSSLRFLFAEYLDGMSSSVTIDNRNSNSSSEKLEKPQQIWGLGLAVITAMVQSLGDSSACSDLVENVIPYFFSEKAYMISYYLSAPDFPSNDHDKTRPRAQQRQTSLSDLKETEHTLMLMCMLAKHWNSWVKCMKELDSQLREKSIHLLAFISRGTQRLGEPSTLSAPLLCPPVLKEDFDGCKKPSFINSKSGWFALSALSCVSKPKFSSIPTTSTALIMKTQASVNGNHISQSYFSDSIAVQIYRITFLLLKFLSLQAEGAARRAEEVGFVDLDHFPELPTPEILHGLQDQAITIVTELCEANRSNEIQIEVQSICCLLVQIMEMALHLELCVLQIYGIRPVLGRVEDFSKEVKLLIKATKRHAFLKPSVKSLKQIVSVIYPGLLQADEFL